MNKLIRWSGVVTITLGITIGVFLGINHQNTKTSSSISASFPGFDTQQLIEHSDAIIIGKVEKVLPAYKGDIGLVEGDEPFILTDYKLKVEADLLNPETAKGTEITITNTGGTVGDHTTVNTEAINLKKGQKVLLYLKYDSEGNRYWPIAGHQSKYKIENGLAINEDPEKNKGFDELTKEIKEKAKEKVKEKNTAN